MNILLISECSGNAIRETRRILDQFSERRGRRTWQTAITRDGLDTLRSLLRKTARKNTAVACYWIRGIDHSELLWIVGAAGRFNARGATPTNKTTRNIVRSKDENDWHSLRQIHLLTSLAALWHDMGKACAQFQARLTQTCAISANIFRHEWISLRIFQAFVGGDDDHAWLERLERQEVTSEECLKKVQADGLRAYSPTPFRTMPPLAQAVGWLIVTHHRLPICPLHAPSELSAAMLDAVPSGITAQWNELSESADSKEFNPYWQFKHGLPLDLASWQKRAAKCARNLLEIASDQLSGSLTNPYIMHLSRLALTLADHEYSSRTYHKERLAGEFGYPLYANTERKTGQVSQQLDEHLLGVERLCGEIVYSLPKLTGELPHLSRHKALRQRTAAERFRWQNKATEMAESIRLRSASQGAFLVNMASTGCGKTLGNARVMYALSDPITGMRCVFALGLRTLTLQTGREYRNRLHLGEDEVAIRVGGAASRELFDHYTRKEYESESAQSLFPDEGHVQFEGNVDTHPVLKRVVKDSNARSLLAAPMLACTIDHLVPATESLRGGHQIVPMLRLLSGDLVLDELDDYDIGDLPAVTRLVHWAGMLGSRVLISSATLPPALVQGMFEAYREGRRVFQRNRGQRPEEDADICCMWVDEFHSTTQDCGDITAFRKAHDTFASKRAERIGKAKVLRRAALLPVSFSDTPPREIRREYARSILEGALQLHGKHHTMDPISGSRVSFGLVRMANINSLRDVARAMYQLELPEHIRLHICVYHSRYPLLMRSAIERCLDMVLNRKEPLVVFDLPEIRHPLDADPKMEHIFIVLGSPVTEVGRDHDYDWAVVEPSSMRSLIQLAGRIHRHRPEPCDTPNILILSRNLKSVEQPDEPAFQMPGFENKTYRLRSHNLEQVLRPEQYEIMDARPRIFASGQSDPKGNLVDLEHARLTELMEIGPTRELTAREKRIGTSPDTSLGAYSWWRQPSSMLCGMLQKEQPFRKTTYPEVDLVLMPDEDYETWTLCKIMEDQGERFFPPQEALLLRIDLACSPQVSPWGHGDYLTELAALAEHMDMDMEACAKRYGIVTVPADTNGWSFHPALGFGPRDSMLKL